MALTTEHPPHESAATAQRLRPGPNGLPRGQVTAIQRGRILAAVVDVVGEVGYPGMTVGQVIGRARVSRKTFYDIFEDREDCFLAAFEQALSEARVIVVEAYLCESDWQEGVRSALARLLRFMDDEPGLARLCLIDALSAGARVLERRAEVLDGVARVIDRGRLAGNAAHDPPELTAEGIVGGLFAVLYTRLLDDGEAPLTELLGSLMSVIVLPYLGATAARAELSRPAPDLPSDMQARGPARTEDPLEGLKMRVTYRTVRVLTVIAEHPGASNREIAQASGIADQGQISRLLNRLARLELLENLGEGQEKGAANAWHLTPRGSRFVRSTRLR